MLCDVKNPWKKRQSWTAKVGKPNTCSLPCCLSSARPSAWKKLHEQKMISAATSLEKLVALWEEAGPVPTSAEFSTSLSLGKGFLDDYAWLSQWSFESDRNSFHIVAKHHTFIHLLWNSKFMNPRLQWCFKSEDFVGKTSKVAHSISMGVASSRLSQKLGAKYRVLLHLIISSHRFLECSKDIWES